MIKYLTHKLPLLLVTLVVGCTAANDFFGNDIIPPSQQMGTYIDSTMGVRTTIFKVDSMNGNITDLGVVGSMIDPLVGRTTAGFFHTYLPLAFTSDSMFGYKPTLDSMFAILYFSAHKGDTLQPIKISIHEIVDSVLRPNYAYYLNADPSKYYKQYDAPLASFELRGESIMKIKLPASFYDKFLIERPKNDADKKKHPYFVDSLWIKQFKGLYFKAEPLTSGKGQLAAINLSNSSVLRLHYHNKNKTKADTTYQEYIFYNAKARYGIGFEVAQHDYSYSNVAMGGVDPNAINNTAIEASVVYIQGLDGLGAKVALDTAHLRQLRAKAAAKGYSAIAVHRAILRWYLTEQTPENYNSSFSALGLYNSMVKKDFIADYNPNFTDQSGADMNPLGGKINRSTGYYEQNITSTIQKLVSQKTTKNTVELLPIWKEMLGPSRSVLGGSASSGYKPQIIITYTLLK